MVSEEEKINECPKVFSSLYCFLLILCYLSIVITMLVDKVAIIVARGQRMFGTVIPVLALTSPLRRPSESLETVLRVLCVATPYVEKILFS